MFEDIRALFREIKDIAEQFDRLDDLDMEEQARELIRLRRRYSEENTLAATLVEAQICSPLEGRSEAQPLLRQYREKINEARGAVADHQAKWPASKIDADPDAYHRSVHAISAMQFAHYEWKTNSFLPEAERLLKK